MWFTVLGGTARVCRKRCHQRLLSGLELYIDLRLADVLLEV